MKVASTWSTWGEAAHSAVVPGGQGTDHVEALGRVTESGDRLGRDAVRIERVCSFDDLLVVGVAVLVGVSGGRVGAVVVDLGAVAEPVAIRVGGGRAGAVVALSSIAEPVTVGVGLYGIGYRGLLLQIADPVAIEVPGVGQHVAVGVGRIGGDEDRAVPDDLDTYPPDLCGRIADLDLRGPPLTGLPVAIDDPRCLFL